ncbi:tetratricopeptide repeat protein [Cystobacter fuscus]
MRDPRRLGCRHGVLARRARRELHGNGAGPALPVRTALVTDQRGAAEEALRQGLEHFPKQGYFGLELGRLLLEDKDPEGALAVLRRVPSRAPEAPQARP